jgi:hypothetical protein
VPEDLDEGVLDGFVRFGGVPQVLISDPYGTALVGRDETFEPLAGRVEIAGFDERADFDGQLGVVRQCDGNRPAGGQPWRKPLGPRGSRR